MEDEGSSSIENGQHHQEFRRGEEDYKKDEKDDDERENLEIEEVLDFQDGEEVDKEMMEEEDRPESIGEDFALPPLTQRTGTFRPRNRSVTDSMVSHHIEIDTIVKLKNRHKKLYMMQLPLLVEIPIMPHDPQ